MKSNKRDMKWNGEPAERFSNILEVEDVKRYSVLKTIANTMQIFFWFLFTGEVTPGLSQVEYALRRHKLMAQLHKEVPGMDHTVILLSNPTYYMSNDIPYTFHQDTNFLYLCGFQEPDSILVLQSMPGKPLPSHKALLFVPRRDPSRELWDGPRSGTDGALALTGVDEAYTIEEFRHLVAKLNGKRKQAKDTIWNYISFGRAS